MAKKSKMSFLFKNVSKSTLFAYKIGIILMIFLSIFLTACFYPEGNQKVDINVFLKRAEYFSQDILGIFSIKYIFSTTFLAVLFVVMFAYGIYVLIQLTKPNKFARGREYGDAEWGDIEMVNESIISKNPEEKYKHKYISEDKKGKKKK